MASLERLIGEIARQRPSTAVVPLWEVHVCEGLADGAGRDGRQDAPRAGRRRRRERPARERHRRRVCRRRRCRRTVSSRPRARWAQVRMALTDAVRQALLAAGPGPPDRRVAGRARASPARLRRRRCRGRSWTCRGRQLQRRRWARGRIFATHTLPLEDIKKVRHAQGVTVNDVVLAVVSGALRRWMAARGERADGFTGGRGAGGHRPARQPAAARRQQGVEPLHDARHRPRRPARAAAADLAYDGGGQARAPHARRRHAQRLGAVHAARADGLRSCGCTRARRPRRGIPHAVQRDRLQRARAPAGGDGRRRRG